MKSALIITLFGAVILVSGCSTLHKSDSNVAQLTQRVGQLEKQVQEISQLLEPLKAQQAIDSRRKALRERFEKRTAQDQERYTVEQLREAEELYQVANRKWGSPEASESLQTMIRKYPDINRTGCATLYVAQTSQGDERAKYLQDCIEKYNDCFYGDGVQVGAYARFLLAEDYRNEGEEKKAEVLYNEIKTKYADAIDHGGNLLVDSLTSHAQDHVTGVGIVLGAKDHKIIITQVLANTPASKGGLSSGLIVQKIDGMTTEGKLLKDCVDMVRGAVGSKVKLELVDTANSKTNTVELTRERIQ